MCCKPDTAHLVDELPCPTRACFQQFCACSFPVEDFRTDGSEDCSSASPIIPPKGKACGSIGYIITERVKVGYFLNKSWMEGFFCIFFRTGWRRDRK